MTQILNLSIKLSTVPDECKIAKLKPLYKKGKKTDPKNYRPISLLPVISKILQKVIHDQTMEFVTKKNFLYKFQSDLRKFHSTDSYLSYLQDKVAKGFQFICLNSVIPTWDLLSSWRQKYTHLFWRVSNFVLNFLLRLGYQCEHA